MGFADTANKLSETPCTDPPPDALRGHPHGADPRDVDARHDLASILFVALAATLCGTKTCVDIADFAASREEELSQIACWRQAFFFELFVHMR
jgi:hypothetical protein